MAPVTRTSAIKMIEEEVDLAPLAVKTRMDAMTANVPKRLQGAAGKPRDCRT